MSWLQRLRIDKFLLVLILVMIIASLFPCKGGWKIFFTYLTTAAIALLFYAQCQAVAHGGHCWNEPLEAISLGDVSQHLCVVPLARIGDVPADIRCDDTHL